MKNNNSDEINMINISEIPNIELSRDSNTESLFGQIENTENIKNKILKDFDSIYLIDVAPDEIDKYKSYKDIYSILKHHVNNNAAENQNLQIMFFQINDSGLQTMKDSYEKYKEELWDLLIENKSKYYMILWYIWWSKGRGAQYVIEKIKKEFDVILIK